MTSPPTIIIEGLRAIVERDDAFWVPLACYIEHYTDTAKAVYARRSRGNWRDGIECKIIEGGGLWINLSAVNRWAAGAKCESRKASPSDSTEMVTPRASA